MEKQTDFIFTLSENTTCEFKEAQNGVPKSFYETYSSFANTEGGDIYLGIKEENGRPVEICGIATPSLYIKNIVDCLNNREKVSLNILDDHSFDVLDFNGKKVLKVHVDEVERGRKPIFLNNNIINSYKRNNEGDYIVNQYELLSMINDRYDFSFDSEINNRGYVYDDIQKETFKKFRNLFNKNNPNNIFYELDDYDFAIKLGVIRKNKEDKYLLTNAAVLFFTDSIKIASVFPNYFVDYQENFTGTSRWDFRMVSIDFDWSGNLFDFFIKTFDRLKISVPNKHETDGALDISGGTMENAIMEALVNAISNADLFLPNTIVIKKQTNQILIENSGLPTISIQKMIDGGTTNTRNKEIMRYFRVLKYSQRSGYGVYNIIEIFKKQGLIVPSIYEKRMPDQTGICMNFIYSDLVNVSNKIPTEALLSFVGGFEEGVSQKEIIEHFNVDRKTISNILNVLLINGKIRTNESKTRGKKYFIVR